VKVDILKYLDRIAETDGVYKFGPMVAEETSFCSIQNLCRYEVIERKDSKGLDQLVVKKSSTENILLKVS
jgi:glucuronate isomerase